MALKDITEKAEKEGAKDVHKEAKKAQNIMSNLMKHVDEYAADYANIRTMENLKEILHVDMINKGKLLFEIKDDDSLMWIKSNTNKNFEKYHLYFFEVVMVAFEIETKEEILRDKKGKPKVTILGDIQKKQIKRVKYF